MPPTISVVIPTYNRSGLLVEAIESALQQTRPPDEIVVIDDGSTDDTAQAIERYGDRVRYVRQTNAGPSAARNRGFAEVRGEFIALLDSDDLWAKDRLERQVAALARFPDLDFVFGLEAKFTTASGQSDACEIKDQQVRDRLNAIDGVVPEPFDLLLRENFIPTSSTLFRKECITRAGPMERGFAQAEDYDLWLRIAAQGFKFGFVNATLCFRRMHEGNLVNQWVVLHSSIAAVLTRHQAHSPSQRDYVARRLSDLHYDLGSRLLAERKYDRARDHLRLANPTGRTRLIRSVKLLAAKLLARG